MLPRSLIFLWGPKAHRTQSPECRCLSPFRIQQRMGHASPGCPSGPFPSGPSYGVLGTRAPKSSSWFLSLSLLGFRGEAAAGVWGQPQGVRSCAFSQEEDRAELYCSGRGRSRKKKEVTHVARAVCPFGKSLSSTKWSESLLLQCRHFTPNLPACFSRAWCGFWSQSWLYPFLLLRPRQFPRV